MMSWDGSDQPHGIVVTEKPEVIVPGGVIAQVEGEDATKLIIKRNQADVNGIFGGHRGHKGARFKLQDRAQVSPEERAPIDRYKVADHILASYTQARKGSSEAVNSQLSVSDLVNGKSVETDTISTLLELEEAIKAGCKNLKDLLMVMNTFGGEEVIEI